MYVDVESTLENTIGKLDVYKVHHHCSSHSSNDRWLAATKPTVGIISTGTGNTYGHPTQDCLERLHNAGTKTYWTEQGSGTEPIPGWDVIAGDTIVEVDLGANQYTVSHGNQTDTTRSPAAPLPTAPMPPTPGARRATRTTTARASTSRTSVPKTSTDAARADNRGDVQRAKEARAAAKEAEKSTPGRAREIERNYNKGVPWN